MRREDTRDVVDDGALALGVLRDELGELAGRGLARQLARLGEHLPDRAAHRVRDADSHPPPELLAVRGREGLPVGQGGEPPVRGLVLRRRAGGRHGLELLQSLILRQLGLRRGRRGHRLTTPRSCYGTSPPLDLRSKPARPKAWAAVGVPAVTGAAPGARHPAATGADCLRARLALAAASLGVVHQSALCTIDLICR